MTGKSQENGEGNRNVDKAKGMCGVGHGGREEAGRRQSQPRHR